MAGERPEPAEPPERTGPPEPPEPPERTRLREVVVSMARIGTIAFGGPAAHLAIMRRELVERRRWVDEQEFLDLMGGASVLPGPTSTEVAIMLARRRAGMAGLVLGGTAFILPAMAIVLVLTWGYVRYGESAGVVWMLRGILPVVIAIVVAAVVGLARTAVRNPLLGVVAGGSLAGYLLGIYPLALLAGGAGLAVAVGEGRRRTAARRPPRALGVMVPLGAIFLEFLKLGSVVFGSGYVLFSYLRDDLVRSHHWLTIHQLLAAVAIGQLTPGPVFTTATSIGEMTGGLAGGIVATVAMFLPSFVLVALLLPVLGKVRARPAGRDALDGVNTAAVALMAGISLQLGKVAIVDWVTALEAVVALAVVVRWRVNSGWLILGGAAVGLLQWAVH